MTLFGAGKHSLEEEQKEKVVGFGRRVGTSLVFLWRHDPTLQLGREPSPSTAKTKTKRR